MPVRDYAAELAAVQSVPPPPDPTDYASWMNMLASLGKAVINPASVGMSMAPAVAAPIEQAHQAMPWGGNDPRAIGIDPQTGSIDPSVMVPWATDVAGMASVGTIAAPHVPGSLNMGIRAYHGSPHDFERFDLGKIGTGEGAQAYGHGLYFAEREGTARDYKKNLSTMRLDKAQRQASAFNNDYDAAIADLQAEIQRLKELPNAGGDAAFRDRQIASKEQTISELNRWKKGEMSTGKMYEVDIDASPDEFLDWDKPLSEQSPKVRETLEAIGVPIDRKKYPRDPVFGNASDDLVEVTGGEIIENAKNAGASRDITESLRDAGIKGIRYKDAGSRGAKGEGTSNFVVFDDNIISILKKYGLAGLTAGGAGAAMLGGGTDQASASQPAYRTGGSF